MKTKLFAALLALFGVSVVGCENPDDSPPQTDYIIALEVVDQDGNDVLADIETIYAYVDVWNTVQNQIMDKGISARKVVLSGVNYFVFSRADVIVHNRTCPPSITWKIKCDQVFGDSQIRVIESDWRLGEAIYDRICDKVVFEGKTYIPELKKRHWTTKVVINR